MNHVEAPIKLISAKWIGVKSSSVCVYLDCLESFSALDSFCQATALPAWET